MLDLRHLRRDRGGLVSEQTWADPSATLPMVMAYPEEATGMDMTGTHNATRMMKMYEATMTKMGITFPVPEILTLKGYKLDNGIFVHENDTTCPSWVGLPFDQRFTPKLNEKGEAVYWGVEEWTTFSITELAMKHGHPQFSPDGSKFSIDNVKKEWRRHVDTSTVYHAMGRPEQQWWVQRAKWKLQDIKKRRKNSLALANTAVELTVGIGGAGLSRTIVVPACVSMRFLAEKVLLPALGWAQAYHHFYFMDKKDGTLIGVEASPRKSPQASLDFGIADFGLKSRPKRGSPDLVCGFIHCDLVFLDDTEVLLSDFLTVGRTLEDLSLNMSLVYDLGDRWEHVLAVKKTITKLPPPGQRLCRVIEGRMAPIPEDHNYQGAKTVVLNLIVTASSYVEGTSDTSISMDSLYPTQMATRMNYLLCIQTGDYGDLKDILESTNYIQWGIKKWDPNHYDNDAANQRLWQALSTRFSIHGSGAGAAPSCECCQDEMTALEADKSNVDGCGYCGRSKFCSVLNPKTGVLREGRSRLQLCAKCRSSRFCSQECQLAAWPVHKLSCKKVHASAKGGVRSGARVHSCNSYSTAPLTGTSSSSSSSFSYHTSSSNSHPPPASPTTTKSLTPLPSDLTKLPVRELKRLCRERAIDTRHALEKKELVEKLKEWKV
eukprot:TRINITY_DN1747_c0_g2_i1.p1 TRINITY_DN1747_c0_g2~~TRINITY_DN1747_c0_g2_i1.p1  ORF type:complete len:660 (-),score=121.61 TRINITY_DN1747_c0_g2_i1:140-2119(-)